MFFANFRKNLASGTTNTNCPRKRLSTKTSWTTRPNRSTVTDEKFGCYFSCIYKCISNIDKRCDICLLLRFLSIRIHSQLVVVAWPEKIIWEEISSMFVRFSQEKSVISATNCLNSQQIMKRMKMLQSSKISKIRQIDKIKQIS